MSERFEVAAPAETLPQRLARIEREAIRDALRITGGNRLQAARRLGIARATLYQKIAAFPELSGEQTVPPAESVSDMRTVTVRMMDDVPAPGSG